jgi:hypothetical protein
MSQGAQLATNVTGTLSNGVSSGLCSHSSAHQCHRYALPSVNPDLDPESQFYVHQKDIGSINYIIKDLDFELQTRISKQWLEEPTFDLVHWYLQYLEFEHQYSEKYEAKQQELYGV